MDLSGGGIRFRTDQKLRENQYVLFEIHLQNENLDKQYYIIGTIISCIKTEKTPETPYEARAKFLITDSSVREKSSGSSLKKNAKRVKGVEHKI